MLCRLSLSTAGESHGPGLTVILSGLPAGLAVDLELLRRDLRRRQHGFGRGRRMQIEEDEALLRGGVRNGRTLGSPVAMWIANRDWPNWESVMSADPLAVDARKVAQRRVHRPRPGHADLAGGVKYLRDDLRDILERASARETAARVAAGCFARMLLRELGVEIRSGVLALGSVGNDRPKPTWDQLLRVEDASPLRAIHADDEAAMIAEVEAAKERGDTLGGAAVVVAHGVPPGLGSHTHWDAKLDGRLAQALMSVPAVKAVELGEGIRTSRGPGSLAHDAIEPQSGSGRAWRRPTNRAGGLEGGVTNGEDLVVTLYKKPIATLRDGLPSIDLDTGAASVSQYERSDVTALPAAGVIGEAMVALVLADAVLEKFGGDSMPELLAHWAASRELQAAWPPHRGDSTP